MLYKNVKDDEQVYRFTELLVPNNKEQKRKMIEYNRDLMSTQNDDDSEFAQSRQIRELKRTIKEELKQAKLKVKHSVQYCQVPANILEEARYRYRPDMTTKELPLCTEEFKKSRQYVNKYENAPHIGRIIPSKKPVVISHERIVQEQQRQQKEETLKWYMASDNETTDTQMSNNDIARAILFPVDTFKKESFEDICNGTNRGQIEEVKE